jgi:hypothetical protein
MAIGSALYERFVYAEDGGFLTGSPDSDHNGAAIWRRIRDASGSSANTTRQGQPSRKAEPAASPIRSLRRAPEEPDHICWLAGEGWWLSTAPVPTPCWGGSLPGADRARQAG